MSYSKHKDCIPEETLTKIHNSLNSVNLTLQHKLTKRMDGIYSAIVYDTKNWWSTSGKGTTEEYCLASGYAEAMEHLCNYFAYNYKIANDNAQKFGGFRRYPDEKLVSISDAIVISPDIFDDIKNSFSCDGTVFDKEKCIQSWTALLESDCATIAPFFSIKKEKIVYLPDEIVGRLSGSTGGGAGNTPYEALSHAFDEISERYAKYVIYMEKLTPPTIPKEYIQNNCLELYDLILQIESRGYRIIVKDASLGKKLPVVSVAIIDPGTESYMIKFGAHCCFNIALERCLTEMFQSYSLDSDDGNGHKSFHVVSKSDDENSSLEGTWYTQLKDDTGSVPISYFMENASWEFIPWGIDFDYTNQFGVRFHLDNFRKLGCKDIFIRNLSFLGFPVYKVYIPGISHSHFSINETVMTNFFIAQKLINEIKKKEIDDVQEHYDILLYCFSKRSYIGSMLLKNVQESLIDICYAALLYDRNGDISYLEGLSLSNKCARSILLNLELKKNGYTLDDRLSFFSTISDEKTLAVIKCWESKNVFVCLLRYFNKSSATESDSIRWERFDSNNISYTHICIKRMMMNNIPDQTDICKLVKECYENKSVDTIL